MHRPGLFCFLALALTACGNAPDTEHVEVHPDHPYTWAEWIERETPRRAGFDPYYRLRRGLPNMSRWRPEDFLPAEYLAEPHADICELPPEERGNVYIMPNIPAEQPSWLEVELKYARRGYAEAQAAMGWFCYQHHIDFYLEPGQLTVTEALNWARRGAASGNPRAMYMLAECMRFMIFDAQRAGQDEVARRLNPFWYDEMYYWMWRAAEEGLHVQALQDLQDIGSDVWREYPPSREEEYIQAYKHSRLLQLRAIFLRGSERYGEEYVDRQSRMETLRHDLEENSSLAAGEARVAAWLTAHPDIWVRLYHQPLMRSRNMCPDDTGRREYFDFAGLNRELSAYGLNVIGPLEALANRGNKDID